jgi:septal ring-binding cell division protein DamX
MSAKNLPVNTPVIVQDSAAGSKNPKILEFDENNTVTPGKDINSKITSLDSDLAQLRMELGVINNSVEEGLDRLGDTNTDLTAKVSETYKRLGEIDNAYKSLLEISSRIDNDIKKLDGDVSTVAEQSATGIKNLEQSTIAQSHEFTQKNQQVASRVNQLVETSKLTSELLGQKIQSTTDNMLNFEKSIVAEIENLSSSTKEKTGSLENSIDSNKAKILKLQAIDEAIIRRATTLEISSAELTVKSQHLEVSTGQLQHSAKQLSTGLNELQQRTHELEAITNSHGSLIDGLQKVTSDITDKLAALAGRETKHFNITIAGFILLLIGTAVIYFVQQDQFGLNDVQIAGLQQTQRDSALIVGDSLTALDSKIELVSTVLQDEIKKEVALLDYKVQTVKDQAQSVNGRLSQSSPFSQIGDDNIIHGAQWIADLPGENFIVQLAYTDNTDAMYEIAQRYNYYLKESLSYFKVNDNGIVKYALLSGNYATQKQAIAAIDAMPRYIDMQQPLVRKVGVIQKHIAQ